MCSTGAQAGSVRRVNPRVTSNDAVGYPAFPGLLQCGSVSDNSRILHSRTFSHHCHIIMCMCMHTCAHVYNVCTCMWVHECVCICCICGCMCMLLCKYVCTCLCLCGSAGSCAHAYMCMCLCLCMCMYACLHSLMHAWHVCAHLGN